MSPGPAAGESWRLPPRVHAAWTEEWFTGRGPWEALFGAAPSAESLRRAAAALDAERGADASAVSRAHVARRQAVARELGLPAEALIVLAGQQPALGGGAALVAHKAGTAVRLAQQAQRLLDRPVVPVFLLADEDHDTSEVDHLDYIDPSTGHLRRIRCPIHPPRDSLFKGRFDDDLERRFGPELRRAARYWTGVRPPPSDELAGEAFKLGDAASRLAALASGERHVAHHARHLLLTAFAGTGLVCVEAQALTRHAPEILEIALAPDFGGSLALSRGAERLRAAGLPASFDPADPRPLVMRSREDRRQRLPAGDEVRQAARRQLAQAPGEFSPHAALRPMVQAATLPVLAQVAGPSELQYLAQCREMHAFYSLPAPVLVPRLELTAIPAHDRWTGSMPVVLRYLDGSIEPYNDVVGHQLEVHELLVAGERLVNRLLSSDPALAGRAERWLAGLRRSATRLAEAPAWLGRAKSGLAGELASVLAPRNRPQDTVLGWLPMALASASPEGWGRALVDLAEPLAPPRHVLHRRASPSEAPVR